MTTADRELTLLAARNAVRELTHRDKDGCDVDEDCADSYHHRRDRR